MKESEQTRDVGQVGQPDMVRESSAGSPSRRGLALGRGRRSLLSDSADGLSGDLPTGSGESLCDELVAAESQQGHGLDQMPDDIGIALDGRLRLHERAHGSGL